MEIELKENSKDKTRFFSFEGRMRRRHYLLINIVLLIPAIFIELSDFVNLHYSSDFMLILILLTFFILISVFATVKRFHDIEYSGWYYFLLLIPIVNIGGTFLLLFKDGTKGPNKYGPDPKDREAV